MKLTSLLLGGLMLALGGCGNGDVAPQKAAERAPAELSSVTPVKQAIFTRRGLHPAVRTWYYELHKKAFDCDTLTDGGDPYGCEACPVGKPDRIIDVPNKLKAYDVPTAVNAFFACDDINMLVPEKSEWVDDDVFLCERKPPTGSIRIDGRVINCGGQPRQQEQNLGTLEPGESKTITIPIMPRQP
jgi:hypothetical protein